MGYFDYLKHGRKMFFKKGELPVYLVYFITDACNAKCKHCLLADGAHPGWEEPSMTYRKQELSLEEIDKVSSSMGKGSLMFLLPTGGEPFLRKDIGEIIKIFHKNTGVRNVGIPTNGSTTARTVSIVKDLVRELPGSGPAHRRVPGRRGRAARRNSRVPGTLQAVDRDVQGAARG